MKQVININFHGRVVPIEITAYEMLKKYTEKLRLYFSQEESGEEIINDIEGRISELFQERLKDGTPCITDDHVVAIIQSMGDPEQFDEEVIEASTSQHGSKSSAQEEQAPIANKRLYRSEKDKVIGGVCGGLANYFGVDVVIWRILFLILFFTGVGILPYIILWIAVPSSSVNEIGGVKKKLYRDPDNKIIAGVCSGIARYFHINPWIPRVMFLIPFFTIAFKWTNWAVFSFPNLFQITFSPGAALFYIILWIVMPEAKTTAEKLEMTGEKVDLESIKNLVSKNQQKTDGESTGKNKGGLLGRIIVILAKAFLYFILGLIALTVVLTLFAVAVTAIGLFPLKNLVLETSWQHLYAWGTLIFFFIIPFVGIVTWLIRKLWRRNSSNSLINASFFILWIFGVICLILLTNSVVRDNKRYNYPVEEAFVMTNPTVEKLYIRAPNAKNAYMSGKNWLKVSPFGTNVDDDTVMLRNIKLQIMQSPNDSFFVKYIRVATGENAKVAQQTAFRIKFDGYQIDSSFIIDDGIPITRNEKFHNQQVYVTVFVPVGKRIEVNNSIGKFARVRFEMPGMQSLDLNFEEEHWGWRPNVEYIMTEEGLRNMDGSTLNESSWDLREKGSKTIEVEINGLKIKTRGEVEINNDKEREGYRYTPPSEMPVQPKPEPDSSATTALQFERSDVSRLKPGTHLLPYL